MKRAANSKVGDLSNGFIDKDRNVMDEYYELLDLDLPKSRLLKSMIQLIIKDPDFFDPYIVSADILLRSNKIKPGLKLIEEAYDRALCLIVDENGKWPKRMSWGFLENRHIMRVIERYAYISWEENSPELALEIYRKLLRVNINDNQGARYAILALRMGLGPDWDFKFMAKKGQMAGLIDAKKIDDWFNENSKKFPEEFNFLILN